MAHGDPLPTRNPLRRGPGPAWTAAKSPSGSLHLASTGPFHAGNTAGAPEQSPDTNPSLALN